MAMEQPCPRYSANPKCPPPPRGASVDYSIKSPIGGPDGIIQPLCKYSQPYDRPVATYEAGTSIPVKFMAGGASHGGGHCQFSVSYDGGQTYAALRTILNNCFSEGLHYDIPIPANAPPSEHVIFAWTWVNAVGNREFYMNCADIAITGGNTSGTIDGPQMVVANYGPNTPYVSEFRYSGQAQEELYVNAPRLSISPSGTTTMSPSTPEATPTSTPTNIPPPTEAPEYSDDANADTDNEEDDGLPPVLLATSTSTATASPSVSLPATTTSDTPSQAPLATARSVSVPKKCKASNPNASTSSTSVKGVHRTKPSRTGVSNSPCAPLDEAGVSLLAATATTTTASSNGSNDNNGRTAVADLGACAHGAIKCHGQASWKQCVYEHWVKFTVPVGTTCTEDSPGIHFV
ncbi:hypothetical protein H4R34_004061 [Dimargaris verticillata]|uniref:Chitin-binding type-4 domain-containing protein n=1 Tax=Dimargaris verticillata TaxID=2761393 RepID=A0A9W8EBH4_9FUNG|nr:hypothetical protein H4R34_004061 [Dimargaris verticillata]